MNIYMMTNTYHPIVGGLERSIDTFARSFRKKGHRVIIVAPKMRGAPRGDDVLRLAAFQPFASVDFPVKLPVSGPLKRSVERISPDLVHAHHPFLMSDTALRLAKHANVPLIFTHHTLFEYGTYFLPGDSHLLKHFVIEISTGFANMADRVFAPSPSIRDLLVKRGVKKPIDVVPTGIDSAFFMPADRAHGRSVIGAPQDALLLGHLGRFAEEKNLEFLCRAVARFLHRHPKACFAAVGSGPLGETLERRFRREGLAGRVFFPGVLKGRSLVDAYAAMDIFTFASKSETQGLVLTEAMACGAPVVALDAVAVRDVVIDGKNGALVRSESETGFVRALERLADPRVRAAASREARKTAAGFSVERCAARALAAYDRTIRRKRARSGPRRGLAGRNPLSDFAAEFKSDWLLFMNAMGAAQKMLKKRKQDPFRVFERLGIESHAA